MTDPIDTAAARRAWEETTQGEWTLGRKFGGHTDIDALDADIPWQALARVAVETEDVYGYSRNPEGEANARFIALAHREYPALLDEIERLRGALKPFAFLEMEKNEGLADAQYVWETIHADRVKDWFSYEEIVAARTALGEKA